MRQTFEQASFSSGVAAHKGVEKNIEQPEFKDFLAHIKQQVQLELMETLGYHLLLEPKGATDAEMASLRAQNNVVMEKWIAEGKAEAFATIFRLFSDSKRGQELLQSGKENKILNVLKHFFNDPRYDLSRWTDEALQKDVDAPALEWMPDVEVVESEPEEETLPDDSIAA